MVNSRVPENRQTENLGDFDGFQPFRMRTFQILRFAEIEINPYNPRSNTGTKKAEWRVTIRHQSKKNGGRTRDRTGDTGIFSPLLYLLSYPATFVAVLLIYSVLGKMQIFFRFFSQKSCFLLKIAFFLPLQRYPACESVRTAAGYFYCYAGGGTYGVRFIHGDSHAFQKFKFFQQQRRGVFCKGLDQQK